MSTDLYDRSRVSVHHSNIFYESRFKIVATQDGQEVVCEILSTACLKSRDFTHKGRRVFSA